MAFLYLYITPDATGGSQAATCLALNSMPSLKCKTYETNLVVEPVWPDSICDV